MQIQKSKNTSERLILTGLIVDDIVCRRISAKWKNDLFRSKWANLVGGWCIHYFNKYGKAPNKHIEGLFRNWEEKTKDKETTKLVEKFISSLSDEYAKRKRESNSEYILDKAGEHFNEVKLERLRDGIENDLLDKGVEKAMSRVSEFDKVEIGKSVAMDMFNSEEFLAAAFAEQEPSIVRYPGDIGRFFGNQFARDSFVAFAAPEKRGKSFLLMDIAFRAALQRRKVMFFEAGDMSKFQISRRFHARCCNRPFYKGSIEYPKSIRKRRDGKVVVRTETRSFANDLKQSEAKRKKKKIMEKQIRSKEDYLRIECFPNSTLHTKQIESVLQDYAKDGWLADVLVIDYADILDMTYPKTEGRDRIDRTWRELRKISQIFHCLVVTATQTNRESYDAKIITRRHSSEDKRKLAHVTAMYGINQTAEEKEQEIMRINCIELRDGMYLESNCVHIAGCLAVGNIAVKSVM